MADRFPAQWIRSSRSFNPWYCPRALRIHPQRGVKFGRKRKLTPQQIDHAHKLIDTDELDCQAIADLFKVNRTTLYRVLAATA